MKRADGMAVILTVAFLACVFLLIIGIQERRLQSLNRSSFLSEIRSWLPAMPAMIDAKNLAATKMARMVNAYGKLVSSSVKKQAVDLKGQFADSVSFLITDAHMQTIESSGIDDGERAIWLEFFEVYHRLNLEGRIPIPETVKKHLEKSLGGWFNPIYIENYLSIYLGSFHDQKGVIMVGSRMDDSMPKQVAHRFTSGRYAKDFDKHICGYYLIFLPESFYSDIVWYRTNQQLLMLNDKSRIFTGKLSELNDLLKKNGYAAAAGQFTAEVAARPTGVFTSADHAFSFCASQFSGNTDTDKYYSIIVTEMPAITFSLSNSLLKGIVVVSLLAMLALCINNLEKQRYFSLSISRHFAWLAASACLLPILALLFQAFSQVQVQGFQARSEVFNQLEGRISALENDYENRLSEMMLSLQLFQERCEAGEKTIEELCAEHSEELLKHSIREFYVCDRSGHIELHRISEPLPESVERSKEGARLMLLLVQFMQHNVKFASEDAKMSLADGLIIETVAEVVGREMLYKYVLQQNRAIVFKGFHGAVWLANFFQYDENQQPVKFFLYVVSRAPFQERMVDAWVNAGSNEHPEFAFSNQYPGYREKQTPTWLENRPDLAMLLRHLNSVGGGLRTEYSGDEQNSLLIGRALNDIDWSALAIENREQSRSMFSRTSVLLFAAIIFLVVITVLVSRYFARIFLVPVRQLSLSVAAMADGNYDLRLDVISADEIGQLCQNFNSMAASLKEKEYLNRFLSDITREAIGGRVSPRATRVEGAVLFSDIRNFTAMTEQRNPEEIVQMLNEFMTAAEVVVVKYSGTIEKFIGDAIMVVFLPSLGTASPTVRATHAAEELLQAIEQMNSSRQQRGLFTIMIGAGIATGPLLMGTIGNQQGRRDYSVTGKTVLRAAAMEKLTRQAVGKKIVICPLSFELAASAGIKAKILQSSDKETGYELI